MKRFVFWLVAALLTLGAAGIARWLGGDSAAGWVLMIIAVSGRDHPGRWLGQQAIHRDGKNTGKPLSPAKECPQPVIPWTRTPINVVALVSAAIAEPWPSTESERKSFFSRLHLTERDDLESEHPRR